jgi:hypothetical protein
VTKKIQRIVKNKQPASSLRRLLRWASIICVALLACVVILWLMQDRQAAVEYVPEVTGGPSAAIDQTLFDYGDVKLGTTIKTVFRVKNVGDAQLAFQGVPRIEVLEGC